MGFINTTPKTVGEVFQRVQLFLHDAIQEVQAAFTCKSTNFLLLLNFIDDISWNMAQYYKASNGKRQIFGEKVVLDIHHYVSLDFFEIAEGHTLCFVESNGGLRYLLDEQVGAQRIER